ncbi:alkylhydroperoxidase [Arthrobacter sp. MYb224]|uniref:carboxymuconolactone decarboxylase family protein n=1 Tax=Micrococcaceae TaxID=1268 RepID=UPI000CFD1CDB|nr:MULTISPECIES: carboxymuconolactone decarboxylase family protein [unclassified Arthrobacter]PQZ97089.1 alkylhydroperoxidase [Arthrobacter sp. MYb224]PRA00050.1 alkylhydroperoxidase [Arthrobacter sp. MYb229]PRB48276.1 alkylhydroperoxidase [Arthrobacter sp. MYb216]
MPSAPRRSVNLGKQHPEAYKALIELNAQAEAALVACGLDPLLGELVKIRVSQLNGCAFCLRMHTRDALKLGETSDRLAVLAAWWESQYFSEVEAAALALAEEVTQLEVPPSRAGDTAVLSAEQVSAISWLTIVMNSWNRIAIRSQYPVAP